MASTTLPYAEGLPYAGSLMNTAPAGAAPAQFDPYEGGGQVVPTDQKQDWELAPAISAAPMSPYGEPIQRLFDPKDYINSLTSTSKQSKKEKKWLGALGHALQLGNPNFNPSSYLKDYETTQAAANQAHWDQLQTADKFEAGREVIKRAKELDIDNVNDFGDALTDWGILGSDFRKSLLVDFKQFLPEKPESTLLTSDVFTKESRTAYKSSGNVADLMIDEKLDLRGYKTRAELRGIETKYRNEFINESKVFSGLVDNYGRLLAAADQDTGAGDLALIFNFMKLNDPGSTVREGEFANAENAPGITARVLNLYEKARRGVRLRPEDRLQFLETGDAMFKQKQAVQQRLIEQYTGLAQRANVDYEQVIIRYAPRITEDGKDYLKIGTYLVPIEDVAQIVDFQKMKGEDWEDEEDDTGPLPMPGPETGRW